MEFVQKIWGKLTCKHPDMVTLKNEDNQHIGYCKRCDSKIYTSKQKWWQR